MSKFPKMNSGSFPHIDTVDVNQWTNDFDYSRYDSVQMKLTVCTVPWDMGEAHIGNRTISGIGNVVYFGSEEKRDEWFASIPDDECYRFETKYKELHRDNVIDVPIPFDVASKYNYLMVEYSLFANDDSPIQYETETGMRKWFWFIREVEFVAPSTTRLHILDDAFQTWIYDVNVSGMILERGHAPMFATRTDEYLADPIDNATDLLTPDVDYGQATISRSSKEIIFNAGNMYALVVTTSAPGGSWGTKAADTWQTPTSYNYQVQGVPGYFAFALSAGNLSAFLSNINSSYPQFVQTVKAIAFISSDMLTLGTSFTFAETTCYYVSANYKTNNLVTLDKEQFGYADRYADLAKLYTYPYACIVLTDETGNASIVRIEDTDGSIDLNTNVSLVFPWLSISGHLSGIGKSAAKNLTFANVTNRNMPIQGNWYDTLRNWNIPTFGIYQDEGVHNDYATHYDRLQEEIAYTNEYDSRIADADTNIANAAVQTAANTAVTGYSNANATSDSAAVQSFASTKASLDNSVTQGQVKSTIAATEKQASISQASSAITGATSAITAAASGNVAGAVGAGVGAIVGVGASMAATSVAVGATQLQADLTGLSNTAVTNASNGLTQTKTDNQTTAASNITSAQNSAITTSTANSAATMKANAGRTRDTAINSVANQVAQADMNAAAEFGTFAGGMQAVSRPMGLFANIVTESDSAIAAAGDEFLRYGYAYGRQWEFDGDWNVGKYFTYWKLRDFWVSNLNVPDMYMDKLRFFLFGGVTVWRDPADIGKVNVYDNFS